MLIDSHCHLDFESFDVDREQVMQRATEAGVSRVVVPSLGLDNCGTVIGLTVEFPGVFAAVGIHPNYSAEWQEEWIEELRHLARNEKVVAIGEIGLDYYRDYSSKELQLRALEAQLQLAAELDLPVILHNRDSDDDLLIALKHSGNSNQNDPGVFHSFSTSWQTAVAALDMGYYLGFSGPVTYKKADDLRAVVSKVPLDRILVETDAPFLAPQRYRGKRNEPAYVSLVAEMIASVRGLEIEEIAQQTTKNTIQLFGSKLS